MPYTPVGVFLIDQWRQIGVTVEHEQLETRLYTDKLLSDELQAGLDYACDFMDEPTSSSSSTSRPISRRSTIPGQWTRSWTSSTSSRRGARPGGALPNHPRVRAASPDRGLPVPDHLVAPDHRPPRHAEELAHHAQPLPQPGPGGGLAGPEPVSSRRRIRAGRRRGLTRRRSSPPDPAPEPAGYGCLYAATHPLDDPDAPRRRGASSSSCCASCPATSSRPCCARAAATCRST